MIATTETPKAKGPSKGVKISIGIGFAVVVGFVLLMIYLNSRQKCDATKPCLKGGVCDKGRCKKCSTKLPCIAGSTCNPKGQCVTGGGGGSV